MCTQSRMDRSYIRAAIFAAMISIAVGAGIRPTTTEMLYSPEYEELPGTLNGPVTFDYLTSSTIVVSERTCLSLIELQSRVKTPLIGSPTIGGYIDGIDSEARFSFINDVVVQGNFVYIADYSCVRIYDIERKKVATLAGACGRLEEPSTSVSPPVFSGHLKLAISARDLYVLHGEKISRVDRETGVVWTLSAGERLSEGIPTSIEVDKYSNTLFVSVAKSATIDVLAVDIGGGRQSLYKTIITSDYGTSKEGDDLTVPVASLDVAPDGSVYVLEPHGLHKIERDSRDLTSESLESYGYHEVGVSSRYLVLSQEFYSRMYMLHLKELRKDRKQDHLYPLKSQPVVREDEDENSMNVLNLFESQAFYLAIVFPSVLFLLVIVVVICAARKIIKTKSSERADHPRRPVSDISSEKYFLNQETPENDNSYWM